MSIVALVRDLIAGSWIEDAALRAGVTVHRVAAPDELPPAGGIELLVVDWGERQPGWETTLSDWRNEAGPARPAILLFGPHRDLEGHAAARRAGLGPMIARSRLRDELAARLAAGSASGAPR